MDTFNHKNGLVFIGVWFAAAFCSLIFALNLFFYLTQTQTTVKVHNDFKLYAALPENNYEIVEHIGINDGRSKIIENFFKKHKAPLADFSEIFITVADKYSLDWRLLPAISMQESNGGKKVIHNSYNPFGYGIYGSLVVRFQSWEEGIERVGRALKEDYSDKGLGTPEQIMVKYTPPSLEKGGAWAKGVSAFMEDLR